MPFQSEKQRKYLWANEPEIAREWTDKYGSRVKKDNGGITNLFGIPEQHMTNWGDALISKDPPWSTTPEYHQWGTHDFTKQKSKQLANIPYIGGLASRGFETVAPFLALGASPIYDTAQAFWKYGQDPGKYETNNKCDKINAYFPDLQGTTAAGILNAIDQENIFSAAYNRMIGAGKVGIESKINRQNQIQDLLKKGWGAIKNEFGGSAEAAIHMVPTEAPQVRDRWNIKYGTDETLAKYGDQGWVGGPLKEYNPELDLNKTYRLAMNEYLKRNKPISYSETDIIPSENTYADQAKTIPYKGSRFSIKDMKNIGLNQDEEETYIDPHRIPGRIQKSVPRKMGILEKFRNRFYKPAAGAVNYGGKTYSPAQLNSMNALGGYYSEPARQQRRLMNRRTNILKRAGEGKPIGNVNLLKDYGYKKSPSGGVTFTGQHEGSSTAGAGYSRSDSGWSSSPFRRGGLASLWQR